MKILRQGSITREDILAKIPGNSFEEVWYVTWIKATDVETICVINKEALGYAFSPEETASQLAAVTRLPSLPTRVLDSLAMTYSWLCAAEVYEPLFNQV